MTTETLPNGKRLLSSLTTKTMNKNSTTATITINLPMEIVPSVQAKKVDPRAWVIADRITTNEALKEVHAEQKELIKAEAKAALKAGVTGEKIRAALKLAGWSKQEASDLLLSYGIEGRAKDKATGKRATQSAIIEAKAKAVLDFVRSQAKTKEERNAILARAYSLRNS